MNSEILKRLETEIAREIEKIEGLEPGTEKHAAAVESLAKLYKLRIEEGKVEYEHHEKMRAEDMHHEIESRRLEMDEAHYQNDAEDRLHQMNAEIEVKNAEIALRDAELNERAKDRYFNLGFNVAAGLGKAYCFAKWLTIGLLFEEKGTYTSPTFKLVWSKFSPFKK